MSLIRQVWWLLLAVLLLSSIGAAAVNMLSARDSLADQVRLKNADTAQMLALTMSQQGGDEVRLQLLIQAQADTGFFRLIRLVAADGSVKHESRLEAARGDAPGWFRALLPMGSEPGVAQVSDGWRAIGRLEVVSHVEHAYNTLWRGTRYTLVWLAAVGLLAGAVAWWGVMRLRRQLQLTVDQAQALAERRYLTVELPPVLELRHLGSAMNTMVARVRQLFESQAAEAEAWRQRVHCDRVTGLAHRSSFFERLSLLLARDDGADGGLLVLFRVAELSSLNQARGHDEVDRLLQALAGVLQQTAEQAPEGLAGRLNGSDFALFVPAPGLDAEARAALVGSLKVEAGAVAADAAVHLGSAAAQRGSSGAALMAQADAALASAELGLPFTWPAISGPLPATGERAWRDDLQAALQGGRLRLVEHPVLDERGRLVHLECPLRVPLSGTGDAEVAARWLPLAVRSGLTADFDLAAVGLALAAIAADGRPRGVNLSPASLAEPELEPRLLELLRRSPASAAALSIDVAESALTRAPQALQSLAQAGRSFGVAVGIEHAGDRMLKSRRLLDLGLAYVKLDAAVCARVADDADAAAFVTRCVQLLDTVGIPVHAEGVVSQAQAQALWRCGVSGLTGPWISERFRERPG